MHFDIYDGECIRVNCCLHYARIVEETDTFSGTGLKLFNQQVVFNQCATYRIPFTLRACPPDSQVGAYGGTFD